ncbi:transposase [Nocardioides aromaticivorans]|uniref:Transposase n=1 Tax=Nocardioides aromaticivorans TaxID=200618 RepID=A0A7Y9ZLT6_9ACTN|nr:transposase [Nocardioides aromaticivorans]NYI47812.1 transposase [Nocardioides aromaticivorans]
MFCGWDWGSTGHAVCLIDDQGAVIKRWLVQHTEDQLMKLFCELAELVEGGDVAQVPVAIERGEGLVVGLIAGAGHPVWMVEPAAFKAARPRWGLAGAKSDLGDAFMLADYARTDGHRLRRVEPVEQATRELAALVRARTALVKARTAASNQLWAVLAEHWPGAAVVFQKLTSQIALAFLSDYPTPQAAALLGERRMGQFCRRHSYRGGKSPAEFLSRGRAAPASASPLAPRILESVVHGSVAQIGLLNTEITRLERDLASALAAHPKTTLLQTLPRAATVSLAALIAETGPLLERCDNPEQVAAMCGAAPVTRASGKSPHRRVPLHRQQACTRRDHQLRRQLPTLLVLGGRRLPTSTCARRPTSSRRPDPRPRMDPSHLGMLDHRQRLRPLATPRRTAPCRSDLTKRAQALHQPADLPNARRSLPWPRGHAVSGLTRQ